MLKLSIRIRDSFKVYGNVVDIYYQLLSSQKPDPSKMVTVFSIICVSMVYYENNIIDGMIMFYKAILISNNVIVFLSLYQSDTMDCIMKI